MSSAAVRRLRDFANQKHRTKEMSHAATLARKYSKPGAYKNPARCMSNALKRKVVSGTLRKAGSLTATDLFRPRGSTRVVSAAKYLQGAGRVFIMVKATPKQKRAFKRDMVPRFLPQTWNSKLPCTRKQHAAAKEKAAKRLAKAKKEVAAFRKKMKLREAQAKLLARKDAEKRKASSAKKRKASSAPKRKSAAAKKRKTVRSTKKKSDAKKRPRSSSRSRR